MNISDRKIARWGFVVSLIIAAVALLISHNQYTSNNDETKLKSLQFSLAANRESIRRSVILCEIDLEFWVVLRRSILRDDSTSNEVKEQLLVRLGPRPDCEVVQITTEPDLKTKP